MKLNMFDPFNDFETNGYLRNFRKDKNLEIIKRFEHAYFEANIDTALDFLASCPRITYADFLKVHHILFSDYYPWAGQDRSITSPNCAIKKADTLFAHPMSVQLAIEQGLGLANDPKMMNHKFGEIMGLFAYGHPFLDGNGRTMLLVHIELCYRAGFSIEWDRTNKTDYLVALSNEIDKPGKGILDNYLLQYKTTTADRTSWSNHISAIHGLNGIHGDVQIGEDLSDPTVAEKYEKFEEHRGYTYINVTSEKSKPKK